MLRKLFFNLAYYRRPIWDTGISPPELLSFIAEHKLGRALELGCGTGTNAITLAKAGWQVIGVDFATRAIRIAKKKARDSRVKADFRVGDVRHLDSITDQFDLILDIGCFHALSPTDHESYIANVDRLLSRGGTYLLYVFFKQDDWELGPGVSQEAITRLSQEVKLISRTDGTERSLRPSAWLRFEQMNDHAIPGRVIR